MKNLLFSGLLVAVVAVSSVASVAHAQAYSYTNYASNTGYCTNLTRNLSYGSRDASTGGEVTQLQSFLVSQNYPGGGSWMVTGYFGGATQQAVRNFQVSQNLPVTGSVDSQTRTSIQSVSCGSAYYSPYGYSYGSTSGSSYYDYNQYSNTYGQNYNYGNYNYNNYGSLTITSLSTYSAQPGSSVTIYGSGFSLSNNTVFIDGANVSATYNGNNALTFIVPSIQSGTYQLHVSSGFVTSNSMTFTVNSYGYPNPTPGTGQVYISSINPTSGAVGSSVTVYGYGFSTDGNSVRFGNGLVTNLRSFDGNSLTFTVPAHLTGYGTQSLYIGSYPVSVINKYGQQSNSVNFNLTSLAPTGSVPTISGVTGPNSVTAGTSHTWTINVNATQGTYVTTMVSWGDQQSFSTSQNTQAIYVTGQQTLTFNHTYQNAGTYTITFTASNAAGSNSSTTSVQVTGSSSGPLSLSTLTPTFGSKGTVITLNGSGFSSTGNTVHFGIGGSRDVYSANGTTITFTIPHFVSPCDVVAAGLLCGAPVTPVTNGSYPVYVTNGQGATNVQYFTVI